MRYLLEIKIQDGYVFTKLKILGGIVLKKIYTIIIGGCVGAVMMFCGCSGENSSSDVSKSTLTTTVKVETEPNIVTTAESEITVVTSTSVVSEDGEKVPQSEVGVVTSEVTTDTKPVENVVTTSTKASTTITTKKPVETSSKVETKVTTTTTASSTSKTTTTSEDLGVELPFVPAF